MKKEIAVEKKSLIQSKSPKNQVVKLTKGADLKAKVERRPKHVKNLGVKDHSV